MSANPEASVQQVEEIQPNATVYVKNIEEKVKIPVLIETLEGLFSEYGTIVDIIAKKSLKRRGQAFIIYDNVESAQRAIDDLDGFDLAGKPIQCSFAKSRSDATVKREGTEAELEEHVRIRKEAKERKQAAEEAEQKKKRPAAEAVASNKTKAARSGATQIDEAAPSNVLTIQGIPEDYDEDAMSAVFSRYGGFKEFHSVPARKGLGFAHFDSIEGATVARSALGGVAFGGSTLTVTYRKA